MKLCDCQTWACTDMRQMMCGNGHNPQCPHFVPLVGAFSEDWGVCSNARSPRDGLATFEHDGCEHWEETEELWQQR